MADQPVEVMRPSCPGVDLIIDDLRLLGDAPAISRATRVVCSSVVPSGMSMMTWNSLLLVEGQHLHADDLEHG